MQKFAALKFNSCFKREITNDGDVEQSERGEPFLKTGATFENLMMEKTWQVHSYVENRRKRQTTLYRACQHYTKWAI